MHLRRHRQPHHDKPSKRLPPKLPPIQTTKTRRPPPLPTTALNNQPPRPKRIPALPTHPQNVENKAARPAFPFVEVQDDGEGAHGDVGVPDGGRGAVGCDCAGVGAGEEREAAEGTVVLGGGGEVCEAVRADQVGAGEGFRESV